MFVQHPAQFKKLVSTILVFPLVPQFVPNQGKDFENCTHQDWALQTKMVHQIG